MVILKKSVIRLILTMSFSLLLTGCNLMSSKSCSTVSVAASAEAYYDTMLQCVHANNYPEASLLYALGGTTTWYDADKHPGEASKNRHKTLLSSALNQLQPEQKTELWKAVNSRMNNPSNLRLLCSHIGSRAPGGVSDMQWQNAMASYLHCPLIVNASAL